MSIDSRDPDEAASNVDQIPGVDQTPDEGQSPKADHESLDDRNPMDVLADEFAHRIRIGETPSIDEYAQQNPQLASEIRAVFPAIAKIEKASRHQLSRSGSAVAARAPELNLEKIGDFQIIRLIGQGGMGIVYEALQVSLQRHVALKVISPAISNSPKQLARFKREAATAARLHHTNIVPVFGSGEEDGVHYYAMQLIEGIPLHEAVRSIRQSKSFAFESAASTFFSDSAQRTSKSAQSTKELSAAKAGSTAGLKGSLTVAGRSNVDAELQAQGNVSSDRQKTEYWNKVCEFIADIADALQYAHEQGVFHRDIKPSNLLMDQHGIVWVTDFGLAKFDDHDGITKTGDIVGTLRYMAPEQFSGDGDSRSDICSLGLTLYELLVLQPAYSETRSAPLMKLKTEQAPPRPSKIDPALPKDLDTIVLKASAVEPKDRYQTAGALRDDLIRFIDGRPITARRVSLAEQVWRWSKRNPMVASLASLSIVLLVAVAIVAVIGNQMTMAALKEKEIEYQRAEASKTEAENALADARKQRSLAVANFSGAVSAFEEIMENISRRGIPHGISVEVESEEVRSFETSLTNSDIEVLETLLSFFEEFAEKNRADLSFQSAQAQLKVAKILQSLGRLQESEEAFGSAISSFEKLGVDKLSARENELIRMRILNELAYCANRRGDFEKAERSLADCHDLYVKQSRRSPEIKLEYARSLNLFTSMYSRVGYVINRRILSANANPRTRARTQNSNKNRKSQVKRQKVWVPINNLDKKKRTLVKRANEDAIRILLNLIEVDQDNSTYQLELSRAYQDRVRINRAARDQKMVINAFTQANRILENLVEKHPHNPAYRFELADFLCNLERSRNSFANPYAAARVAKELVENWPSVSEYQALYANAQARSAIQRLNGSMPVRKRLEDSVNIYRELVAKYPAYYAYKINLTQYLVILATQYSQASEFAVADRLFDEAQDYLQSIESDSEDDPLIRSITSELAVARKAADSRKATDRTKAADRTKAGSK